MPIPDVRYLTIRRPVIHNQLQAMAQINTVETKT